MNTYARNVLAQIEQTIDDGLARIEAERRVRELEAEQRQLQEQLTWSEHERAQLLAQIEEGERS